MRPFRLLALRLLALALIAVPLWATAARAVPVDEASRVDVVQVNGLIDPANAALIRSALHDAERAHATAVVFQLNASGAVDVDVASLLHDFTHASVPVAVWVGPSGGGAHGAAALLARSAQFAAVAPGAHLGAVDPIRYDETSFTLPKPPHDVTASAATLLEFIGSLNGKIAHTSAGDVTMATTKVVNVNGKTQTEVRGEVTFHKLDLGGQLQHTLDSPWVAYFFFVAGLALMVFEFYTASIGIAGGVGAVMLIGGCYGFSHLPVAWWAVGLLLFGIFGLTVDVQAGGLGPWTFIGGASLVAGSIWLYNGSSRLDPQWWVLVLVIGGTVVFMLSGMTAMIRSRFSTPTIGREDLVGEMGNAEADVDPDGVVRIREALWRARTNRATPIRAGEPVRVVSVEGIVLEVEPESGGARDHRERRKRS